MVYLKTKEMFCEKSGIFLLGLDKINCANLLPKLSSKKAYKISPPRQNLPCEKSAKCRELSTIVEELFMNSRRLLPSRRFIWKSKYVSALAI